MCETWRRRFKTLELGKASLFSQVVQLTPRPKSYPVGCYCQHFGAAQAAFQVLSGPVGRWCQDHFGGPFGATHAAGCESRGWPPVGSSLAQRWSFGGCNAGCHAMATWCTPLILGQTQVGAEVWPIHPLTSDDSWLFLFIPYHAIEMLEHNPLIP